VLLEIGIGLMSITIVLVLGYQSVKELLAVCDGLQMQDQAGIRPHPFSPVSVDKVLLTLARTRVRGRSIIYFFIFFILLYFLPRLSHHRLRIVPRIVSLGSLLLLITIVVTNSYDT
jgi:hypothetical protein